MLESKILDILKARGGWVSTGNVVRDLGYKTSSDEHTQVRTLLNRMLRSGKVSRQGSKNFYWIMKEKEADAGEPPTDCDTEWIDLPGYTLDGSTDKAVKLIYNVTTQGVSWFPRSQCRKEMSGTWQITPWIRDKKIAEGYSFVSTKTEPGDLIRIVPPRKADPYKPHETPPTPAPKKSWEKSAEAGASSSELKALRDELTKQNSAIMGLTDMMVSLTNENVKLKEQVADNSRTHRELKIQIEEVEIILEDVTLPKYFDEMLDLAKCGQNIMLVGPAGCGKSYSAELLSRTLDRRFGSVSCTAGMSESQLTGKALPNIQNGESVFQSTDFIRCFEEGGVFLLDEMDAADPNMLLCFNSALANGWLNVPNRPSKPRAKKHNAFLCIAAVNTFGRGADRSYAGRNALDEASLDRFRIGLIEVEYDPALERALCPDDELREQVQNIRRRAEAAGLRRTISTRFLEQGYVMKKGANWSTERVVNKLLSGWKPDELMKVR